MFSRENVSFPLFRLTVGVLPRRAAPGSEGLLRPAVLLIEAPALGDLVGTGLSPVLCAGRLDFPSGDGSFGRTGEHLVLQAGLPTAESGQGKREDSTHLTVVSGGRHLYMRVLHPTAVYCVKCNLWESALTGFPDLTSAATHKRAMSYSRRSHVHIPTQWSIQWVRQAAGSYKQACTGGSKVTASRDLTLKQNKNKKVNTSRAK